MLGSVAMNLIKPFLPQVAKHIPQYETEVVKWFAQQMQVNNAEPEEEDFTLTLTVADGELYAVPTLMDGVGYKQAKLEFKGETFDKIKLSELLTKLLENV